MFIFFFLWVFTPEVIGGLQRSPSDSKFPQLNLDYSHTQSMKLTIRGWNSPEEKHPLKRRVMGVETSSANDTPGLDIWEWRVQLHYYYSQLHSTQSGNTY